MNQKIVKLDINKKYNEKILAKQGDTKSRFLLFNILDNSTAFDLTDTTVRVYAIKADYKEVFNDLVIISAEKGVCILELTNQFLAIAGTNKCELVITKGVSKLSSIPFEVEIIKSINSENAIVSTNEFTALTNALASLSEYDSYKDEIRNGRGTYAKLKDRFESNESQLETIANIVKAGDNIISIINDLYKNSFILKNGTYEYTSSINIRSGLIIKGESVTGVILKPIGGIVPFLNREQSQSYENITIENITIDCTNCSTTVGGLSILKSKNIRFRNVVIKNLATSTGLYINESGDIELDNVIVDSCKYGIGLFNSKKAILNNCEANNNKWDGFITNFLQDSELNNCYAERNGYDCGVGNTACGFYIAWGSENVILNNPTTKVNSGRGIELDRVYNCKLNSPKTRGDNTGVKIIGSSELDGNINNNQVNNVDIECLNIPISTSNSIGNKINGGYAKGGGTHLIFDDGTSGSNNNDYKNISFTGTYSTAIINSNSGKNSTFENITFKYNPVMYINNQTLYIDFVNGNDNNDGLTNSTPIKSIYRLSRILNMLGQTVEVIVLGTVIGLNATDWSYLGRIYGFGNIILNFENRTVEFTSTVSFGESIYKTDVIYTVKNVTISNTTSRGIYFYRQNIVLENVISSANLSVESLSGSVVVCKNCNITPIMRYDNSSAIVKDRWDSTSVIHTSLLNLSPS